MVIYKFIDRNLISNLNLLFFIIIESNINGEISDGDDNNLKPSSHDDEEDSPPPPKIMLYEGTCFRNICGNLYFHWKKMELIFATQNCLEVSYIKKYSLNFVSIFLNESYL